MKLTFVSPRYGEDIVGGAEYAVRKLAENCVKFAQVEAEVLTTTAGDERTWSPKYEAGTTQINGVQVTRFQNEPIDRNKFDHWSQPFLSNPLSVTSSQFDDWLKRQGPYSPELLGAISQCESDALVFHPMLSSPASHGILRSKVPTVLHPALHDESLARMTGYGEVLNKASLLAFSTRFEQDLSMQLHSTQTSKQVVLGFGIDAPEKYQAQEINEVLTKYELEKKKYLIVLGRVDPAKGSDLVAKFWEYSSKYFSELDQLVFVGPVSESSYVYSLGDQRLKKRNIVATGAVDDREKNILLKNANILVNPSVTESFSLVVLEAMQSSVPVLVNRACGPTFEHVNRSKSGLSFNGIESFISAIKCLSSENNLREISIGKGKSYVSDNYEWSVLIAKYIKVLKNLVSESSS